MALGLSVIFLSVVIPLSLTNFFGANTTGWDASTIALWSIIPLALIATLVFIFIPRSGGGAS